MRRAARILGTAVASCVHLLCPDVIVLGGGLVEAMPELYVESVATAAKKAVMPSFVDTFKIVAAKLGDDAGVLGCAAWTKPGDSHLSCGTILDNRRFAGIRYARTVIH